MFGSKIRTLELALGTAIGYSRSSGIAGALRSPLRKSTGSVPRLPFCVVRDASIEMPGLLPNTSVKSLIPPRWYAMLYPPLTTESPGAPKTACFQPSLYPMVHAAPMLGERLFQSVL